MILRLDGLRHSTRVLICVRLTLPRHGAALSASAMCAIWRNLAQSGAQGLRKVCGARSCTLFSAPVRSQPVNVHSLLGFPAPAHLVYVRLLRSTVRVEG